MRTIRLFLMMVGISITCMLYAQETNNNQNENKLSKGIKIGSRNYSRVKKGFFAPVDISVGIVYDYETLHFSYDDISNKPLNGGRLDAVFHVPLSKKGIISLECPIYLRANYVKDTQIGHGYNSISRWEAGEQIGLMLSTGYCFREKCYVTIGGGIKLDFCVEESTLKRNKGENIRIGNWESKNRLTKYFDAPISFSASFRYKRLGIRVNYDIGTINRYKKDFYKKMNIPENFTKKNNHFCIGIQYYCM